MLAHTALAFTVYFRCIILKKNAWSSLTVVESNQFSWGVIF